jgi:hypothetical protein
MTEINVLTIDMALLVGIFLLGLLAKMFPKTGNREHPNRQKQRSDSRN